MEITIKYLVDAVFKWKKGPAFLFSTLAFTTLRAAEEDPIWGQSAKQQVLTLKADQVFQDIFYRKFDVMLKHVPKTIENNY